MERYDFTGVALEATGLLNSRHMERAIEKYAEAFRIRALAERKGKATFWYAFAGLNPFRLGRQYLLGENRDALTMKHLLKKSDRTFIGLIALNYLYFNDKRAMKYLSEYAMEEKTLEQKILTAMVDDSLGRERDADRTYAEVLGDLRRDESTQYEVIPTIKGKVYTVASRSLLKRKFLFKECGSYPEMLFEAHCSRAIKSLIQDETSFDVSIVRPLILNDGQRTSYNLVINREDCQTLEQVIWQRKDMLTEAIRYMALVHAKLEIRGMRELSIEEAISRLNYPQDIKSRLASNIVPIKESMVHVPVKHHLDGHLLNFGLKETEARSLLSRRKHTTLVLFDLENKNLRPITDDLAKMLFLPPREEDDVNNQIRNYSSFYEMYSKGHRLHYLELPFLNSAVKLAFSYPSSIPGNTAKYAGMREHLRNVGIRAIQKIKASFPDFYRKHSSSYSNLSSILGQLS